MVKTKLSPTEERVLSCVAVGMSNPEIGRHLGYACKTVCNIMTNVYCKLDLDVYHGNIRVLATLKYLDRIHPTSLSLGGQKQNG
jgi:DNA-binding NarL/FixJ family response regulator